MTCAFEEKREVFFLWHENKEVGGLNWIVRTVFSNVCLTALVARLPQLLDVDVEQTCDNKREDKYSRKLQLQQLDRYSYSLSRSYDKLLLFIIDIGNL